MSGYCFTRVRREIHLDAAHRNALNPASDPNGDTLKRKSVALLMLPTRGIAVGGREVHHYEWAFIGKPAVFEGNSKLQIRFDQNFD